MTREVKDELTENGIKTNHPDVTTEELGELHGTPDYEDDDIVVYSDAHGYALNEWSDALEVSRGYLSKQMLDMADDAGVDRPWGYVDPIVFDAESLD